MRKLIPRAGAPTQPIGSYPASPAGSTDIERLQALIAYCRANGVNKVKINGVELELTPAGEAVDEKQRRTIADALGADLSDEDLLFFSAPQYVPVPRPDEDKE